MLNSQVLLTRCKEYIKYFSSDDIEECLKKFQTHSSSQDEESLVNKLYNCILCETNTNKVLDLIDAKYLEILKRKENRFKEWNKKVCQKRKHLTCDYETLHAIKVKHLYFQRNVKSLTGWKVANIKKGKGFLKFKIFLSKDFCESFAFNKDNSKACIFMRCVNISNRIDGQLYDDKYPSILNVKISTSNSADSIEVTNTSKQRFRNFLPTILNEEFSFINKTSSTVGKEIDVEIKYHIYDNKSNTYAFNFFTSTELSIEEMYNELKEHVPKKEEKFYNDLESILSENDDIEFESFNISLKSAMTFKRIETPFRGINCKHMNPDDLKEYLCNNYRNEIWKCKICKASCTPDEIFFDQFYCNFLKENKNLDKIEMNSDIIINLLNGLLPEQMLLQRLEVNKKKQNEVILIDDDLNDSLNTTIVVSSDSEDDFNDTEFDDFLINCNMSYFSMKRAKISSQ
uniref:SP-RING-type domain-containing protein n=1 Tax=Parastrongyloides trichosuri TaxID=131310 RepID=A0A0N4ZF69_PARTI